MNTYFSGSLLPLKIHSVADSQSCPSICVTLSGDSKSKDQHSFLHPRYSRREYCLDKIDNNHAINFQVDAVVLKLTPLISPKISAEFRTVEKVVKAMFQHRRKYIKRGARLGHTNSGSSVQQKWILVLSCTHGIIWNTTLVAKTPPQESFNLSGFNGS